MFVSDDAEKWYSSNRNKLGRTENIALYSFMRWSVSCGHKRRHRKKTTVIVLTSPRETESLRTTKGPCWGEGALRTKEQA